MSPEVSNEAEKRNIPWLTRDHFPNLWPLDVIAATYLTESHKYTRRVRNRNAEVQDVRHERVEDDEPNGEMEAQEQDNGHYNQVSLHLQNSR